MQDYDRHLQSSALSSSTISSSTLATAIAGRKAHPIIDNCAGRPIDHRLVMQNCQSNCSPFLVDFNFNLRYPLSLVICQTKRKLTGVYIHQEAALIAPKSIIPTLVIQFARLESMFTVITNRCSINKYLYYFNQFVR